MKDEEYMELVRRIHSRIYRHTNVRGSKGTYAVNRGKVDECMQILQIIADVACEYSEENEEDE